MKKHWLKIILVLAVCLGLFFFFKTREKKQYAQKTEIWSTDFSKSVEVAKKQNKKILLLFGGSDWCVPCMALSRDVFDNPEYGDELKEKYVLIDVDFPLKKEKQSKDLRDQNMILAEGYHILAYPTVYILDADKHVLDKMVGYDTQIKNRYLHFLGLPYVE